MRMEAKMKVLREPADRKTGYTQRREADVLERYLAGMDVLLGLLIAMPLLAGASSSGKPEGLPEAVLGALFLIRGILHGWALYDGGERPWSAWVRLGTSAVGLMVWTICVAAIGRNSVFQLGPILSLAVVNVLAYAHAVRSSARDAALA